MLKLSTLKKNGKLKKFLNPVWELSSSFKVVTDTRENSGGLFFAIPGARTNSLEVILNDQNLSYEIIFFQENNENIQIAKKITQAREKIVLIPCDDIISLIQEIALQHRIDWRMGNPKRQLFAISGSNGKTTTKEMIAYVLKSLIGEQKIIATEKNYNNHLGVPLTLFRINEETEMAIIEFGSNHPGEIQKLCEISQPDSGIVTNIGETHMEFFPTLHDVFKEEGYLYDYLKTHHAHFFFLINCDDSHLKKLSKQNGNVTYGSKSDADFHLVTNLNQVKINNSFLIINNSILGDHNFINLAVSYIVATHFYPEFKDKISHYCSQFKPTFNRSQWILRGETKIFLDAYNANPSSMLAALKGFKDFILSSGKTLDSALVVIGDMNELGEHSEKFHFQLAPQVENLGFKNVFFIGRFAEIFQSGLAHLKIKTFKNASQASLEFSSQLKEHEFVLIKGSRSLQLESLLVIT